MGRGRPAIAGPTGAMGKHSKKGVRFDNATGKTWVPRREPGAAAAVAVDSSASSSSAVAGGHDEQWDVDADSDAGTSCVGSCVRGDSTCASSACASDVGDDFGPSSDVVEREQSTVRDTVPLETSIDGDKVFQPADRSHGANISWFFGNWGAISNIKHPGQQERMQKELRHSPAAVICLAECSEEVQRLLEQKGRPKPEPEVVRSTGQGACPELDRRAEYQFMTLRGKEESSILCGARTNLCQKLELLSWDRIYDGVYKNDGGKMTKAYTRLMTVRVTFWTPVAYLGESHACAVAHLHRNTAKRERGGFKKAYTEFWDTLATALVQKECKVFCGDLNMAACAVVPQLRNRNVQVETAACYFWKDNEGHPCMDSCGIWFVDCPGMYKLCHSLKLLHDKDGGILKFEGPRPARHCNQMPDNKGDVVYFRHPKEAGPGQRLSCYLPKTTSDLGALPKGKKPQDISEKDRVALLLTPSDRSKEYVQRREKQLKERSEAEQRGDKSLCQSKCEPIFVCKEKRLDVSVWEVNGEHHRGAHYPLMVSTAFEGARSQAADQMRRKRKQQKQKDKRWSKSAGDAAGTARDDAAGDAVATGAAVAGAAVATDQAADDAVAAGAAVAGAAVAGAAVAGAAVATDQPIAMDHLSLPAYIASSPQTAWGSGPAVAGQPAGDGASWVAPWMMPAWSSAWTPSWPPAWPQW